MKATRHIIQPVPGDMVCSSESLPTPEFIYREYDDREKKFSFNALSELLTFLEMVVLHERIIVGTADTSAELMPGDLESEAFEELNARYFRPFTSIPELPDFHDVLNRNRVTYDTQIKIPEFTPSRLVKSYDAVPLVRRIIRAAEKRSTSTDSDKERALRIAHELVSRELGIPLVLNELACLRSIPFKTSEDETVLLADITNLEKGIEIGVIEHLKKKLDTPALHEIERLEALGHSTIFPRTPIAGEILAESNKPADLMSVTMSLRKEYSGFRREMARLEKEVFDPDLTLDQKRSSMKQLNGLANELWSGSTLGFQEITSEISAVGNLALSSTNPTNYQDFPMAVLSVAKLPWETVRKYLRRRKIRAMLRSKEAFLNSRPNIRRISTIFGCNEALILSQMKEERKFRNIRLPSLLALVRTEESRE